MKRIPQPSLSIGWKKAPFAVLVSLMLLPMFLAPPSGAQTYHTIHAFAGGDGEQPSWMVMDSAGRLYGVTQEGGPSTQCQDGCGVVYRLAHVGSGWIETILYIFNGCSDGAVPDGLMIGRDGALYGTTQVGGSACAWAGNGTVFKLTPPATICRSVSCPWTETVLYRFSSASDGVYPLGLAMDANGNIFGSTINGGANTWGSVYELTRSDGSWNKTTLWAFTGDSDGGTPSSPVLLDTAGNVYGTTRFGGIGDGTVFKVSQSNGVWTATALHAFNRDSEGGIPVGLMFDSAGNLYGGTSEFGTGGGGTVYKLHPDSGNWTLSVLSNFPVPSGPFTLTMDPSGNLFGATEFGGGGFGSVFKLTNHNGIWARTDLHDFGFSTGAYPDSNLLLDANGNVIGSALEGGFNNQCTNQDGCGVVWEITP